MPTFQHYENGELKDAFTLLNDFATVVDGEYRITTTYFTRERVSHISCIPQSQIENYVLENKAITKEQYDNWRLSYQYELHLEVFNHYLDSYLK